MFLSFWFLMFLTYALLIAGIIFWKLMIQKDTSPKFLELLYCQIRPSDLIILKHDSAMTTHLIHVGSSEAKTSANGLKRLR